MSRTDDPRRLVPGDADSDADDFTARTLDRLPPATRPTRLLVLGAAIALALLTLALTFPALLARGGGATCSIGGRSGGREAPPAPRRPAG